MPRPISNNATVSDTGSAAAALPELWLKGGADRRLRAGHLWVYSNEVDVSRSPLTALQAGDTVCVRGADGRLLGAACMEPQALICARLYDRGNDRPLDRRRMQALLGRALAAREADFSAPCYRLVYGDSDGLPGLVVDRFRDILVLQLQNAIMERHVPLLVEVLVELLSPRGILLRGDSRARREQGLDESIVTLYGEVPDLAPLEENGVAFLAPVKAGQKTGWFYDHRLARARLASYVKGARVLDVYSYIGGWGIQAAAAGAREVLCVDSSALALQGVEENARLNGCAERVGVLRAAADVAMQNLRQEGEQFDVVILDPPAFIQRRRDQKKGFKAYQRINELALQLLRPGGVLVSGSCSMHLSRGDLQAAMQGAARRAGCELRVLEQCGQGPDHPVHPLIPETDYLKAIFARRLPAAD